MSDSNFEFDPVVPQTEATRVLSPLDELLRAHEGQRAVSFDALSPEVATDADIPPLGFAQIERAYIGSFVSRLGRVAKAAGADFTESEHKGLAAATTVSAIGTQVLDRCRISVIMIPKIATEALENTHSPTKAGLAAGAFYFGWNLVVGETLNQSLHALPRATSTYKEEFPASVELFRESLPGMTQDVERYTAKQEGAVEEESTRRQRVGAFLSRNIRRGLTGVGLGSTAFVATAAVDGLPTKETRKINVGVATGAGAIVAGGVGAVAQGIQELPKHGHAELAMDIQEFVSNTRNWYVVAGVLMVSEFFSNRRRKAQLIQQADQELTQ